MHIITKDKEKVLSLSVKEIKADCFKCLSSELAQKILNLLAKNPSYPKELAKQLKVHEQKVYYHIRNFEKAGIVKIVKKESKQGAIANYYALTEPGFFVKFDEFKETQKVSYLNDKQKKFFEPFIKDGRLDSLIVVGSPDPHGPEKARSRDGYYGIDFALFLGTFLNYVPKFNVKLDTEVNSEDLNENLIVIGGPVVNKITSKVNPKLPIRFEKQLFWNVLSTLSGNSYPSDETGLIVKMKSPFNKDKFILLIAGKRFSGTRAAIIAFLQDFEEITKGNKNNPSVIAKVVEGMDMDSDGIIDYVEFRE